MGIMRRILIVSYCVIAVMLTWPILLLNLRMYYPSSAEYAYDRVGSDVVPQLNFIGSALKAGAGEQMQGLFPEGYFFTHALYGLGWVEVGLRQPDGAPLRAEALQKARWTLERLDSPAGRAAFSASLDPPYGVFYVGWSSWLRGGALMLQAPNERDPTEATRFQADCAALAQAFDASPTPFLSAYPGQAWPVDSVVAVAALSLHDALFPPSYRSSYRSIIARWELAARERLDPATGLLPHRADSKTGQALEGARGSSQSVIQRFLVEIDPEWGRQQYALFRQQFVAPFLGVPGVLEYPSGVAGRGDVDSGPLVAGFSASATVVEMGAALVHGDRAVADPLINASEVVGLPISWGGEKRYAFGLLQVGDAFLVWSKTARPWLAPQAVVSLEPVGVWWWRWPWHGLALVLMLVLWCPMWFWRLKGNSLSSRRF